MSSLLFPVKINPNAKGKNIESLQKSRAILADFKLMFGEIPTSILSSDRNKSKKMVYNIEKSSYTKAKEEKQNKMFEKFKQRSVSKGVPFYVSGVGPEQALSTFPQDVGTLITHIYCPRNGVVYDPFAGHNSRMQLVWNLGLHYIGVDVCHEFMEWNRFVKSKLELIKERQLFKNEDAKIQLIEGDSSNVDLPDDYADFSITSPPYWNVEYYGPEPEQLGNAKTYERFLELITSHIEENYRILKPGSFCCWFVNDFRQKGKFYPYHIDLYPIFKKVGFVPFNTYIVDLGKAFKTIFLQQTLKSRILPKRHEYILIFQK